MPIFTYNKAMIKIYVSPSCSSCKKVKKWFNDQNIPYEEKNIFASRLTEEELKDMLIKAENGTDDIVSNRSKIIKEQKVDIESNNKEKLEISFSSKYMLEALKTIKDEDLLLLMNGDTKPIVIKSVNDESLIQLILPIKTY